MEIYQTALDRRSEATLAGDEDAQRALHTVPIRMTSAAGTWLIETQEELLLELSALTTTLQGLGATHFIRICHQARFLNSDYIEGWHMTYVLDGATMLMEPFGTRNVLHNFAGAWRMVEGQTELANASAPIAVPRPAPGHFAEEWASKGIDIRTERRRAEPVYRAFLDALTACSNARDFEGWSGLFLYPHTGYYDGAIHHFAGAQDKRALFHELIDPRDDPEGQQIVVERRIDRAEFTAADEIVGYHEARICQGPQLLRGPVGSRMILKLHGSSWRCAHVTNMRLDPSGATLDTPLAEQIPTLRHLEKGDRS